MNCLALRGHGEIMRDARDIEAIGKSKGKHASPYRVQPHYDIGHASRYVSWDLVC